MSALSAFLHPAVPTEEKELVISKRFLGADGKPVPFKIRALTQEENSSLLKASTRKKKVGQQWQDEMDANEYSSRMIVAATVFPDFHSAELCENYNTKDPVQVPGKMLLSGEFLKLITAINELSGLDEGPDEEAKKLIAGDLWDIDVLAAYYCFDNLGWSPGQYDSLPEREKALVRAFALRTMEKRLKESRQMKEAGHSG